ncbi:MAG: PAS domain-containing protein, partial [Methanomicrobiales archaeon]|nr:PAS domain-containing protein [Methanomicrobiales archaeon]
MSDVMNRFSSMKIGTKILIICLILVIIPSLVIGSVSYIIASGAINDQVDSNLVTLTNGIQSMTSQSYDLSKTKLDSDLNLLRNRFAEYGAPSITGGKIAYGSHVVNDNFEVVDSVEADMGSKATVFQKSGTTAIRVSTNVIGADGKRAIGTEVSGPVYDAVVNKGQTYYGMADVVGRKMVVAYEPIKNARGEIIGILFVGVPEDNVYGPLKQEILSSKIGENGYLYVINSQGTLVIHPTLTGENMGDEDFVRQMIADKNLVTDTSKKISYLWEGKDAVAFYTYFAPLDYLIVARVNPADFSGPVDNLRNAIIIILIISIGVGSFIALRFGNTIARRMGDLVELGRKVMVGDFAGAAMEIDKNERMVTGGDEIGEVSEAFTGVVNNIQLFSNAITAISADAVHGKLTSRGDAGKFQGGYATMIQGLNNTINAVVGHLDAIPVPAFIINKDYAILYANKASATMAGSSPKEMVGQKCYDLFKTGDCRTGKCASGQCMAAGRMASSETQATPKDKQYDIAYSGVPILDENGNAIGAMEFFTDLTDIREAARQAQGRIDNALAFINGEMGKIQNGTEQANANV